MSDTMKIPDMFSLEGRLAVVTGALGLLGRHHCAALAEAGATVVVSDMDGRACHDYAVTLSPECIGVGTDVTDSHSVQSLRDTVLYQFGRIDVLVNNAAVNDMVENPISAAEESAFENYPLALWKKVMDVNVTGTFLCSQILGREMAQRNGGSIINIASTYGVVAPDQSLYIGPDGVQRMYKSPVYPTSKGAVLSFTRFLAAYWGRAGVRVNALSPGGVANNQDEFFQQQYAKKTPLGRMAAPTDYKGALVFLASDASRYMTGANLLVDGGWTAW